MMVGSLLARVALNGQLDSNGGVALVAAAAFLMLLLASALLRFWISDYRKS